MPVDATLADAEPDMEPNNADDRTETLAAPPRSRPAAAAATPRSLAPWPYPLVAGAGLCPTVC